MNRARLTLSLLTNDGIGVSKPLNNVHSRLYQAKSVLETSSATHCYLHSPGKDISTLGPVVSPTPSSELPYPLTFPPILYHQPLHFKPGNMGNTHSQSSLESCIQSLAGNRALSSFAAFPGSPTYKTDWARLYNLNFAVVPAAVARPETAEDVAGLVKCARENGVRVQAKSGGHSYGYVTFPWVPLLVRGCKSRRRPALLYLQAFPMGREVYLLWNPGEYLDGVES